MAIVDIANDNKTNVENSRQFQVSSDAAKLAHMLSSTLYQDKITAVLHEVGANCVDAHALNGNTNPWDLVIPTTLDPHVRFRDYGPGLPEQKVYDLLTVYGSSDKTASNSFIGAFGLGAKSPAAVTKTWNIISRFNRLKTEYFVFSNEHGVPAITKLKDEPSDEESGLEVIIPVNPRYAYDWTSRVSSVFAHYAVKPNVINYRVTWPEIVPKMSGTDWFFTPNSNKFRLRAIANHREYVLDTEILRSEFGNAKNYKPLQAMASCDTVIRFNIGEIELSLSRENVQYTKHTKIGRAHV